MSVEASMEPEEAQPNSGTGAGLIAFLNWAIRKNELTKDAASALRTGSRKVLETDGDWATLDMRSLDVEDLLRRFRNKERGGDLSDKSVAVYEQRFTSTVDMYRKWLANDLDWRPSRTRSSTASTVRRNSGTGAPRQNSAMVSKLAAVEPVPEPEPPTGVDMVTYPLPIRPGVQGRLVLPENLTAKEAKRVANFVAALAFDEQLAITAGEQA